MTIEATPDIQTSLPTEMTISDKDGKFRIRGLNPNTKYMLNVKKKEEMKYIRPKMLEINMLSED